MGRPITATRARFEDMMELRRLNEDLQARNKELDAYAHTVAHSIRGSLALIIGFAEVLRRYRGTMSEEKLEECLETIEKTGRKTTDVIEQLLLLARGQDVEAEMTPLDTAGIVAEAEKRLAHMIEEHQAEVILPAAWPLALGYGPWVEEVWVNYLTNAIKYGSRPPRVELGALVESDGMVRFWVRDNGPGLTPADQDQLFGPFPRFREGRRKGCGLGLSISQRIVEKLGGQVGVESEVGQGSVFTFTLPGIADYRDA